MAAPNLLTTSTVTGETAVLAVTTTATNIVNNAASSGKLLKIESLIVSNVDGTNAADITASVYRSSVEYKVASTISVPADSSIVVISKSAPIYLEEGDALRLTASVDSDLEAVCSYLDIS